MQQIKGAVLKSRLAFVEQHAGKEGVEQVLQSLPPADQRTLRMVFTSNWYPFDLATVLDDAIVRVIGAGDPGFFERLGEASAETNLGGIHSGYLTKGDAHAFLAKAPSIYSLYYESGRREYQPVGPSEGVLTTIDAASFSTADCRTVIGWHRKALEMCGIKGVQIVEEECRAKGGAVCRYRLRWARLSGTFTAPPVP
jgi:hypothetical protein